MKSGRDEVGEDGRGQLLLGLEGHDRVWVLSLVW